MCEEPAPLENGYRIGNELWEGKNVTYGCNKGYWLRGPLVRVCNEIGNWTEDEPACEGMPESQQILGKLIGLPNSLSLKPFHCDGQMRFHIGFVCPISYSIVL